MELFEYLMAKKGHNMSTRGDLFSYLLGKGSGGGGKYTTFTGTSLNISNTLRAKIKNFMLNSTELTQDGTPTPSNPIDVNVIKNNNAINICNKNIWDEETQIGYYAGGTGEYVPASGQLCSKNFINVKPNTTYYFVSPIIDGNGIRAYDKNKEYIGVLGNSVNSVTTQNNCYYIKINLGSNYGGTYNNNVAISLNSTEYVPHQEQNYPITLGSKNLFNPNYYLNQNFAVGVYKYTLSDVVGNRGLYFTAKIKEGKSPINGLYVALSDNGNNPNRGTRTILSVVNGQIEQTHHYKDFTGINDIYIAFNPTSLTWAQIDEVYEFSITTEYVNNLEYCKIGNYADQIYPSTGKNLFDLKNENFIKRIDTTTLSILSDGFTVNKTDALLQERITVYKQLKPNTTYTISTTPTSEAGKYLGAYLAPVDEISTSAYPSGNAGLSNVATTNSYGILAIIFYFSTSLVGDYTVKNIQLEEGSTVTRYEPYGLNEWCLMQKVGKISSYNGETITTPYISTTGGLDTGATVYYGLETPTYIHISQEDYPTLKGQLDNLYNNAESYDEQTNITQTNDDLPFNISVDVKVANE